jgi:hypothetical protein
MIATTTDLLLLFAVVMGWPIGGYLQWRNLRRQERIVARLQRLRLHISDLAARRGALRFRKEPREQITLKRRD